WTDNCPAAGNAGQADTDADGVGDVCDPSPRGPDSDGDGTADRDDSCPAQAAATPNGCRAAVPTLTVPKLSAARTRCGARACRRAITLRFASTGASTGTVTIAVKHGHGYRTVTTSPVAVSGGALRPRLPAGRYRLTVTVSGPGGKAQRAGT